MARLSDFKGTQEYKEPSRCLGPFGDPGPRVGEVEGGPEPCTSRGEGRKVLSECVEYQRLKERCWKGGYDQRVGWLGEARMTVCGPLVRFLAAIGSVGDRCS